MVWDEAVAANMVASGLRCTSATRVAMGLPGAQPKPGAEPLVDLVPKTQRDMVLKVGGSQEVASCSATFHGGCGGTWLRLLCSTKRCSSEPLLVEPICKLLSCLLRAMC